jgi:hypothetical protein
VADLGPAIVTIIGTSIGGAIAAGAGILQARSQERIETRRLTHEQQAARAAQETADREAARQRERDALIGLGQAVYEYVGDGTFMGMADVRRYAYQVNDAVLHQLVEASSGQRFRDGELLRRAGYLLHTEPGDRTPTGHQDDGDHS